MLLVNRFAEVDLDELLQYNFGLDIQYSGITDNEIEIVQGKKIPLNLWTVDDMTTAHKYGRKAVDYITTNSITTFKD